jgi:hypothetical protein
MDLTRLYLKMSFFLSSLPPSGNSLAIWHLLELTAAFCVIVQIIM